MKNDDIIKKYYDCLDNGLDCVRHLDLIFWKLFNKKMVGYYFYLENNVPHYKLWKDVDYTDDIYTSSSKESIDNIHFLESVYSNEDILTIDYRNYYESGTLIIGDSFIINKISCDTAGQIRIYAGDDFDVKRFLPYIKKKNAKHEVMCNIVTVSPRGAFDTNEIPITRNVSVNITMNYNDDLPYKEIVNFCKNKECGLTLLYGEPGTGKSTFLKHLISLNDNTFYLMDSSLLNNITQSSFLQFLISECSNSVIILEDCEKLLVSRDLTNNPIIGTLLNLSDGILGDALNIKFICTFNTDVSNIDKAALRKGRLKISYKFDKLTKEKANLLGKTIGLDINKSMSLADIYNQKETSYGDKKQTKIGF